MTRALNIQVYVPIISPEKTRSCPKCQFLLGVLPSNDLSDTILIDFRRGAPKFCLEGAVKIERIIDFQ